MTTSAGPATDVDARGFVPVDVLLADGSPARVRAVEAGDRDDLVALHERASDESVYRRFFSLNRPVATAFVDTLCRTSETVWSLVVVRSERLVGLASAARGEGASAEIAVFVDEDLHGLGIGTLLVERLAGWSHDRGVDTFTAEVLTENLPMLRVFHDAGFELTEQRESGVVTIAMDLSPNARWRSVSDERERRAERRSLAPLFEPASIAVLGVSRRRGGIGREVLENLRNGGYAGSVHALGKPGLWLPHVECVSRLEDLPRDLDMVVVALPSHAVEEAVRTVARRGARTCVVLTSGLGETGEAGRDTEARIAATARAHGMRLVGPNCFGVVSHVRGQQVDVTFGRTVSLPGTLAIGSQSGGVGVALLEAAAARGTGLACFVSMGNKADVSGNDLVEAWADDPAVSAAALYLESFQDPRKFARVAAAFSRRKPLLAVFGGSSAAGTRAGASHTAAHATPARAVQALFRAAGVVEVDGVRDLVDTAALLTEQPLPRGPRLGIVGNAGGLGIISADAAHRSGLDVPALGGTVRAELARRVPGAAGTSNPVDLGAAATAQTFADALDVLLESGEVDAVLVVAAATAVTDLDAICSSTERVVGRLAEHTRTIPVLSVMSGAEHPPAAVATTRFATCESAVLALRHAVEYAAWRRRAREPLAVAPDLRPEQVGPAEVDAPSRWLSPAESSALLEGVGVRTARSRTVADVEHAARAGAELGYPVVAKTADASVVHKTEGRLVRPGLTGVAALAAAVTGIQAVTGEGSPVLVQEQVSGPELAVGLVRDARFGPLVMVSSGGVELDLWGDQEFLMPPLERDDVLRALQALRTWPLLDGFRGAAPVDVEAVVDLVHGVERLALERPDVLELDLNPVIVTAKGPVCVDAKVRRRSRAPRDLRPTASLPSPLSDSGAPSKP